MPAPNYTIFEYRWIKDPISQEKGHALLANNKHYAGRKGFINLFGLHIAVVADDTVLPDGSGEALNRYGATTTRDASWHVGVDTDTICVGLPDHYTAWVQGVKGFDFNSNGLGAEIATLQTDWRKIPAWRKYRFLRHLAAWYAPRVMKYKNSISLQRNRNIVQSNVASKRPAGFAYHGDLDPTNRTDPGLVGSSRIDTFPIEWFFELLRDEINIRLKYHGNVYKDSRFKYTPYVYGKRAMEIFCVGEDVARWQRELTKAGFPCEVDESFGPAVTAQTLAFQAKYMLVEDGIAGPGTQAKMADLLEVLKAMETKPKPKPKPEPKPEPVKPKPEVPSPKPNPSIPVSRASGATRYDTNVALIKQRNKGGDNKAYVCSLAEHYSDNDITASLGDGIIFGCKSAIMPSNVLAELVAYKPTSVVIVGGPNTVAETVVRQIELAFTPKEA